MYIIPVERILKSRSENSEKLGKDLFNYDLSSGSRKYTFTGLKTPQNCLFFLPTSFSDNHEQKSWNIFAFVGVFQFTQVQPLPSPHKQCWTRASRIFSEFQLCIGWGEGQLQEISKTLHCFKREPRNNRRI